MHIGVVGDGFSAAEFAIEQVNKLEFGDALTIIGPNANEEQSLGMLGRGLAYDFPKGDSRRHIEYLLNSPASRMDDAFSSWIPAHIEEIIIEVQGQKNQGHIKAGQWLEYNAQALSEQRTGDIYFPRAIYGDFHNERVEQALLASQRRGVKVNRVSDVVTKINKLGDTGGFVIESLNHQSIEVDFVAASPGAALPGSFSDLRQEDGNINQLYGNEEEILGQMRQDSGSLIVIIGGNAAMLDTVRMIRSHKDMQDQKIIVVAPSGKLPPSARIDTEKRYYDLQILDVGKRYESVDAFLEALIQERDLALSEGYNIPAIRTAVKTAFPHLSDMLPFREKSNPKLSKVDEIMRRGTPDAVDEVEELIQQGIVTMVPGKVMDIFKAEQGVEIQVDVNSKKQEINAVLAINTTGAPSMAKALQSNGVSDPSIQLMRHLVDEGMVSLHETTGQIEVGNAGETNVEGLYLISPAVGHKSGNTALFAQYDAMQLAESARNAVESAENSSIAGV